MKWIIHVFQITASIVFSLVLVYGLSGCDDMTGYQERSVPSTGGSSGVGGGSGGDGYHPPPATGGTGGSFNPGGSNCQALPASITLIADNCSNQTAMLAGFHREAQPNVVYPFNGIPFNSGVEQGSGVELTAAEDNSCGPVTVGIIAVGPVKVTSSMPMEWFTVDKNLFDLSFQQNMGYSPSWNDYQSASAVDHLAKMFDCTFGNSCSLRSPLPNGSVQRSTQTGSGFQTDPSVCAWTLLVARSL